MDTLTRMRAFIDVVEAEGFSAAARKIGRSKALLSKYVRASWKTNSVPGFSTAPRGNSRLLRPDIPIITARSKSSARSMRFKMPSAKPVRMHAAASSFPPRVHSPMP